MKKTALIFGLFLSVVSFAQAKTPFEKLEQDLYLATDQFQGDDCTVDFKKLDEKTIKVTFSEKGKVVLSFYAHDGKLKVKERSTGDDYKNTYTNQSGDTLSFEAADDAFNTYEATVGSKHVSCEQDM